MSKKYKLDEYHYHEALDRTNMIGCIIDEYIRMHPVIRKHKKLKRRAKKAERLLAEVYQLIGGISYKKFGA